MRNMYTEIINRSTTYYINNAMSRFEDKLLGLIEAGDMQDVTKFALESHKELLSSLLDEYKSSYEHGIEVEALVRYFNGGGI